MMARHILSRLLAAVAGASLAVTVMTGTALAAPAASAVPAQHPYRNFSVAIYIPVSATRELADPQVLRAQFERVWSQIHFNKVYLEVYRGGTFADPASLAPIASFFRNHGITVDGGITLAKGGNGRQFGTFDYENPADVAECERAVRMAASHFDTVILDDFFFYNSHSDADIKAKGSLSWTEYRLRKMRSVAENVVLKTARSVNPRVKMIIKYPNWYEHFQGLGYDLDVEAKKFDYIYTGTETRDPVDTDQLLQQYESYLVFRYYNNIRPDGGDRGGWVDTFSIRYADRYAEQLWDTLFAKAPEITLFSWPQMAASEGAIAGDRAGWEHDATSFDWNAMVSSFKAPPGTYAVPGWARVAGYSLAQVDQFLGRLGTPIGIASYKPFQSSGEDFLQDYLGDIGIPLELTPHFPKDAPVVLLTQEAAKDPDLVQEIEAKLKAGGDVIVTSGLLQVLQHRGFENIAEIGYLGNPIQVSHYFGGFGAGSGDSLNVPGQAAPGVIFPQLHFFTNDTWPLIRGEASAHAVPILLETQYSRGSLYVLNVPSNMGDLYRLPEPVLNELRGYLLKRFPVGMEAPARVALFAYDNHTFIVESYRAGPASVRISVPGSGHTLVDVVSGASVASAPEIRSAIASPAQGAAQSSFVVQLAPHSYRVFEVR